MQWTLDQQMGRAKAEAGQAVVANLTTDRALIGWAKENGCFVYIGRSNRWQGLPESPWSNRACVLQRGASDAERIAAVIGFERNLLVRSDLLDRLFSLRGCVLGCWCSPKACHGDVIARLVNSACQIEHRP